MKHNIHTSLIAAIAALSILAAFSGCSSTRVETSWTAPEAAKFSFKKTLVVMLNPDGATRRLAEDTVRQQMPTVNAVPSYTLFPDNDALKKGTHVQKVLKEMNFDSAIVVRLVSKDTEVTSMAGPGPIGPYGSFWGAYGAFGWGGAWGGDIQTNTVIGLETNVYEMSSSKLVYSAITKTIDPSNVPELIKDAGQALHKELQKQGLVPSGK